MIRPGTFALMLVATLTLSGCESDEEKAERYYQSALTLMEEGDVDRALIELQNVFQHDGFHREARELYADTLFERGDYRGAYGQYLRLVEQYPDSVAARLTLVELSIGQLDGNATSLNEIKRHIQAVREIDPENTRLRSMIAVVRATEGIQNEDEELIADAYAIAESVLEEEPDNLIARRVVFQIEARGDKIEALPALDELIRLQPENRQWIFLKFDYLTQSGRTEEAEEVLAEIFERFPEDEDVQRVITAWYEEQGKIDELEAVYRQLAGEPTGPTRGQEQLHRFLFSYRGPEAARANLEALIEANAGTENEDLYQFFMAQMEYSEGDPNGSIPRIQAIVDAAEPSDQTRRIEVGLARLLAAEGNEVGARALVEEVLTEDDGLVDALKLRASWLIDQDRPDDAIVDLRRALNEAPEDTEIMILMARAHRRAGNIALAGERLARAVEISGQAAPESLVYAEFLLNHSQPPQPEAAERVLQAALQSTQVALQTRPNNSEARRDNFLVMQALAQLWLVNEDWENVERLQEMLRATEEEVALDLAEQIEAARLLRQNRTEDGLALIEDQLRRDDNAFRSGVIIVMARMRTGEFEQAREYLNELLAEYPQAASLRLLDAELKIQEEDYDGAAAIYRALIEEGVQSDTPSRMLYLLLNYQQKPEEAEAVLDAGIEAFPNSGNLLWTKAGILERRGDYDEAIEIYETIYAGNSENDIIANNLASLLSVHRSSPEDLERAYAVARRLRGNPVPAFQDTYGWIEYRRGNYEEALASLEPAGTSPVLIDDPLVQAHLGLTYAALDRVEEARAVLERAVELGAGFEHPTLEQAAEVLEGLPAE